MRRVPAMTALLEQTEARPGYRVSDPAFKDEMTRMMLGYLGLPAVMR